MNETRRPTLRKGSRIAIVSPASAAKPELIERGCGNLRAFGYELVIMPHALSRGPLYYAGTAAERVADIHAAFADPSIDGIFCTRGGWGSAELLPLLDVALIRSNRKVFVGYSDHTSLHTWLWNECSLETYYAPMVAADWSKEDGIDERTWRAALHAEGHWNVGARDGLRVLQPGEATGRLLGGCLSILTAGLGTPWAIRIDEPCILLLEDIHTKPYQWDRMLQQLNFASIMDHVTGIVFGDMSANIEPSETPLLEAACLHALRNYTGPIALGLKSGHVQQDNRSVPLGIRVKMANEEVSELSVNRKHIHLTGICGTAMASLAGMLRAQGHRVTGSDAAAYPPMSDQLRAMGIAIMEPYSEQNLEPRPDLVVVGNAISRGNPELELVLDKRIPMTSMAALIHDEFLLSRERLIVCGTHGKTTTTSMLAWIYEVAARHDAKLTPSFLIGGVAENFGTSFQVVEGTKTFILEGDEYDTAFFDKGPKFLHYFPDAAILTHVEFDHADIYADLPAVKTAFKRMVNLIPRRGRLIAFDASETVTECCTKALCRVERYGFNQDSYWQATAMQQRGSTTHWILLRGGEHFADLTLPMAGEHNALNATAAAALAAGQGIPAPAIIEALATFKSVKRRLEIRAEIAGITIIDDFAHHPTAIRETLRALRAAYPGRRLWAVLEPRSNTLRRNVFEREIIDSLALADQVVVASVFKSEAIPVLERLDPEHIIAALISRGVSAVLSADADTIVSEISPKLQSGDVVAILSNGGFGDIYAKLPKALEALPSNEAALFSSEHPPLTKQ